MLPVMRPHLPTAERLLPYLRRIDEARIYSNFGPLYHEFSDRLGEYFGVGKDQIALVANGTLALQAAVETVGEIGDTWVMPSFTFVASGQAILAARRKIHFVDVNLDSWAIDPIPRPYARGTMVVAPFGSQPEIARWHPIEGPKVFDAASCFDACAGIGSVLDDRSMVMVSLHATKPLAAGEGAVLIGPADWIKRAARWANFGFAGTRIAAGPGMNAKMSEYHAAVGLASLDGWSSSRHSWQGSVRSAQQIANEVGLPLQPSMRDDFVTSTWNVLLPEEDVLDEFARGLERKGVATRSWWPSGVHTMSAFSNQTSDLLPNTDSLVSRAIGLPFSPEMTLTEFGAVHAALRSVAIPAASV